MSRTVWKWQRVARLVYLLPFAVCTSVSALAFNAAEYIVTDDAFIEPTNMAAVELGQLLFFDAELSGNRNISCASCHHPTLGTADGVSLSIGEGGKGLGPDRVVADESNPPEQRIGRHSPAVFNLGAKEFEVLFHDGRLESDPNQPQNIRTPLAADMVRGFDSILSAQSMFPVLSGDEMAGHYSENDVSTAVRLGMLTDQGGAWDIIAKRIAAIPEYRQRFEAAYNVSRDDIDFTDISNAIADFLSFEFRADNSPFDRYVQGGDALEPGAMQGLELFYGKAQCSTCHSGPFQTDHKFHAIAMPQFGPGKAARFENHQRDVGRMRVTGDSADAYKFRTPSLRNLTLTAPYGHTGAYATLEGIVRHHLDPVAGLNSYDRSQIIVPALAGAQDWAVMDDPAELIAIANANELKPIALTDTEVENLIDFLHTLTDPISKDGRLGVPKTVPSGLPVD